MTACVTEGITADSRTARHSTFTIAADGAYAARLNASGEGGWYPERWTLDGPEPYAVPLPGNRPEEADSQVLPLADGRVLIARRDAGQHQLALLYPTGPSTGELCLGAVESERLTLLPPAPCGRRAYALTPGDHTTGVWLVSGSSDGSPQLVAEVPGHCTGGAWLDREGRLLAVDRTDTGGTGRTKTVAVDLARHGEVSPLLQITDESDDRLLLADIDSGLLIVRSNAPGEVRLGWGVLGSHRPIRFPESLHPEGALLTPFAVQPGQMLLPESCAVALHGQTTGARAGGAWLGVWRPMQRELRRFRAPGGWLPGKGVWTREGELRLPCATAHAPCGLARLRMRGRGPAGEPGATVTGTGTGTGTDVSAGADTGTDAGADTGEQRGVRAQPSRARAQLPSPDFFARRPLAGGPPSADGAQAVRPAGPPDPREVSEEGAPFAQAPQAQAPAARETPDGETTHGEMTGGAMPGIGTPRASTPVQDPRVEAPGLPAADQAVERIPASATAAGPGSDGQAPHGRPFKPVPLQDAPLPTAPLQAHGEVVPTRTA
ncbi:MAG TPA: hypothetical protein VNS49_18785 [Streptomyces sp.]|nr:hypothetical protein [Streptomyces sp.]